MDSFKKYGWVIFVVIIIILIAYVWYKEDKDKSKKEEAEKIKKLIEDKEEKSEEVTTTETGTGTITWNIKYLPDAETLYNAMYKYGLFPPLGTDEDAIFDTLKSKTDTQRIGILNAYNAYYGRDLLDDFGDDLDGVDLLTVLDYYK